MMICSKNECTGCGACYNICPVSAIKMMRDMHGEMHPAIDDDKCIKCGKCKKVCPANHQSSLNAPVNVYAALRRDNKKLKNSASGGIAAVFSEHWIADDGVVYGTAYGKEFRPQIVPAKTIEEIEKFKGSKYVQSDSGMVYKEIKERLKNGEKVMFIGTPCQIAGLYAVVGNPENLITIEILCHGVSQYSYFKENVDFLCSKVNRPIDNITFRSNQWMMDFYLAFWHDGKVIYEEEAYENNYFCAFLKGLSLRSSCYSCHYKSTERIGDIMIGDFIGLENTVECNIPHARNSLVITLTNKGQSYLDSVSADLFIEQRTIEEALKDGRSLREPFPKHKDTDKFRDLLVNSGFMSSSGMVLKDEIADFKRRNRRRALKRKFKLLFYRKFNLKIEDRKITYD